MTRINITQRFEEYCITEEQFKTYFGLNETPNKVYAAIVNRNEDGIYKILLEMLNDENIINEIKNSPVPYQQTALIEGMPEPPMSESKE